LQKYDQHLVVDAGGWSERRADNRELATRLFLEGMQEVGLQVANVAGRDLLVGPETFASLCEDLSIDFVSANVLADGEPLVERFRVYERQLDGRTVRVGVTGVTLQSRAALERWKDVRRLEFADAVQSARDVLEEMRSVSDVQMLLAELPTSTLEELADPGMDGYDILVSSLAKLQETTPMGPTPAVLAPGSRGKQLTWVNLRLEEAGVEIVGGEVLGLDEKIPDDPHMATRVLQLKERLNRTPTTDEGRVSATEASGARSQRPDDSSVSPRDTP
jgi:2',3'-cyclic-nucleotide 2'-phosphodiesterase (5'-nucleotidase family)